MHKYYRRRLAGGIAAGIGAFICLISTTSFWGTMIGAGVFALGLWRALVANKRIKRWRTQGW